MLETLYLITVLSVHDGDTMKINLPCEIVEVCKEMPIRINGIDTPEITDIRPNIKLLAKKAKLRVLQLVTGGHKVTMKITGRDKYFRLDAEVFSDSISIGDTLIAEGLAKPYTGVGLKPW